FTRRVTRRSERELVSAACSAPLGGQTAHGGSKGRHRREVESSGEGGRGVDSGAGAQEAGVGVTMAVNGLGQKLAEKLVASHEIQPQPVIDSVRKMFEEVSQTLFEAVGQGINPFEGNNQSLRQYVAVDKDLNVSLVQGNYSTGMLGVSAPLPTRSRADQVV